VTDHAATNEINLGPDRRGRWAKVTVPASRSFLLGRRHRPARTALWPIGGCGGSSLTPGRAGWSR
jgi:hypothetical protein